MSSAVHGRLVAASNLKHGDYGVTDATRDLSTSLIWLFPKTKGPVVVVPIIRTIVCLGLFWGPLFMEHPYICGLGRGDKAFFEAASLCCLSIPSIVKTIPDSSGG